jgi:hypothetical protein
MSARARSLFVALSAAAFLAACADTASTAPDLGASFAKSGTATGGGGSTGGGSSTPTPSTSPAGGPPVAPSFTARIDSIGIVPTGVYYGTPSQWTVGGYSFEGNYFTHLKAINGPLVVGACVSVTFSESGGLYIASEIKSVAATKCS